MTETDSSYCNGCGFTAPSQSFRRQVSSGETSGLGIIQDDAEESVRALARALALVFSKNMLDFGRVLIDFGFVTAPIDPKRLQRLTVVMAKGALDALVSDALQETSAAPQPLTQPKPSTKNAN